jgi:glycolate oxidase FAD binding subunit
VSTRSGGRPARAERTPRSVAEVAETLAAATAAGRAVRIRGAGTKPWATFVAHNGAGGDGGDSGDDGALALRTTGLNEITAHDPGDMTASLQAGVPLSVAQARFHAKGQMLALDPPLGRDDSATIGGIVASADRGPLAHRYGGPRDLVVGATVALADGTIARSGGTVIKNVAGYDIAKLLCGSFGTLGVIVSVNVRLHPRHPTATAVATADDPGVLARAAHTLAGLPAELEALDVAWEESTGSLLARCAGPRALQRAERIARSMRDSGLDRVITDEADEALWAGQRARQRSQTQAVLHVAAAPAALAEVLVAARGCGASVVARAALGEAYLTVEPDRIATLRARLGPGVVSVLHDCPAPLRSQVVQPWGTTPPAALALMRAVKDRFDPTATCNPHTFVGGI